jgi:hypothetical protein
MPKKSKQPKLLQALSSGLTAASGFKFNRGDFNLDKEKPKEIKPKLGTAIKASYGDQNSIEALQAQGYAKDPILSSHNQSVFYNERSGKMLYDIAGTHNVPDLLTDTKMFFSNLAHGKIKRAANNVKHAWNNDAITDVRFAFGGLKGTDRYRQAKDVYEAAKKKYGVQNDDISIVGHSLGGALASAISDKDKGVHVTTYNKAVGLGGLIGLENNHAGEKAYRSRGDVVSLLGAGKQGASTFGKFTPNFLEAHSSDNLKVTGPSFV